MAFALNHVGPENFRNRICQKLEHQAGVEAMRPSWEYLSSALQGRTDDRGLLEIFEMGLGKTKRLFSTEGTRYLGPLRELHPH